MLCPIAFIAVPTNPIVGVRNPDVSIPVIAAHNYHPDVLRLTEHSIAYP
jgi:hypothetical protein